MIFESDEIKANINKQIHEVTFAEAEEIFDDINSIESLDALHSDEELRFRRIGLSNKRLLFVVFTIRQENGEETIRIITARKATAKEKMFYNQSNEKG